MVSEGVTAKIALYAACERIELRFPDVKTNSVDPAARPASKLLGAVNLPSWLTSICLNLS